MIAAALVSFCLAAEQWADEPVPQPEPVKVVAPRFGPVAGVHLGVSVSNVAPDLGARAGVRVRLGQHAALSLFADLALFWLEAQAPRGTPLRPDDASRLHTIVGQRVLGLTRIELISSSASPVVLVPKLTVGLYFGPGFAVVPGEPVEVGFAGGLHFAITRLDPSGWWLPVFVDLGLQGPWGSWRFAFGVGI